MNVMSPQARSANAGPFYYGQPLLKPHAWDWKVPAYMFVAGIGGAAQLLSTVIRLSRKGGGKTVVNGRRIALASAAIGGPLLIGDLHYPRRWYNMLRIFRVTSPMSIGSYFLTLFGALSAGAALAQPVFGRLGRRRAGAILGDVSQLPAAALGAGMSVYTAALLSATSTPLWAAAPRLLALRFGSSAMAGAAALLSLLARRQGAREEAEHLDRVAMGSTAIDTAAALVSAEAYRRRGVGTALRDGSGTAALDKIGLVLGHLLPLASYALARSRRSASLSVVASLGVLAGGLLLRSTIVAAGKPSAESPAEAHRMARRRR
jgi:protein NrfD